MYSACYRCNGGGANCWFSPGTDCDRNHCGGAAYNKDCFCIQFESKEWISPWTLDFDKSLLTVVISNNDIILKNQNLEIIRSYSNVTDFSSGNIEFNISYNQELKFLIVQTRKIVQNENGDIIERENDVKSYKLSLN
jgi:hypothetical protein